MSEMNSSREVSDGFVVPRNNRSKRPRDEEGDGGRQRDSPFLKRRNLEQLEDRRKLRTSYRDLHHTIEEEKEGLISNDPRKFNEIISKLDGLYSKDISKFDGLYSKVREPREQIADAEAVLEIANSFFQCLRETKRKSSLSPTTFVSYLINKFRVQTASVHHDGDDESSTIVDWGKLDLRGCGLFRQCPGLSTMLGPLEIQPKIRKTPGVRRSRIRPTQSSQAEEVKDRSEEEARAQTDANMETMFKILRSIKQARLDELVLNRVSFSQTVENIFAISFLVKDGRVAITYDKDGSHIVAPRNAPTAAARSQGEATNTQLVFRFDWTCWQMMQETVREGLELMPDRPTDLPS